MKGKPIRRITSFFTKFYIRYNNTISLNKNPLLSGTIGFIVSLVVAYMSTKYSTDNFANSALTVKPDSYSLFSILFHLDNKKNIHNIYWQIKLLCFKTNSNKYGICRFHI